MQHAEKFDLDGGRHVSNFIEEEGAFVGELELAGLAGGGSGERSSFVAEKFALQQIFGDSGAVDLDERAGCATRFFVDGAGNEIFADPAFSAQQHGGVGGRDPFDGGQHFLHFGTDGDDVGVAVFLSQGFAQRAILFAQARVIEFLVHHHPHFGEGERLEDVVAGSGFHGLDRGLDGPERGHDDDGQRGILLLGGLQKFEPIHAGKFEIGEDEVNGFGGEQLQTSFGVSGGERLETIVAEVQLEQAAHLGFVFDDEDGWHVVVSRSSLVVRYSLLSRQLLLAGRRS